MNPIIPRLDRKCGRWLRSFVTECRICLRPLDDTAQVSHCFRRSYLQTRWDVKNCWLAHNGCHRRWEKMNGEERKEMMVSRLGQEGYDELCRKAYSNKKWSPDELKKLEEGFEI